MCFHHAQLNTRHMLNLALTKTVAFYRIFKRLSTFSKFCFILLSWKKVIHCFPLKHLSTPSHSFFIFFSILTISLYCGKIQKTLKPWNNIWKIYGIKRDLITKAKYVQSFRFFKLASIEEIHNEDSFAQCLHYVLISFRSWRYLTGDLSKLIAEISFAFNALEIICCVAREYWPYATVVIHITSRST